MVAEDFLRGRQWLDGVSRPGRCSPSTVCRPCSADATICCFAHVIDGDTVAVAGTHETIGAVTGMRITSLIRR